LLLDTEFLVGGLAAGWAVVFTTGWIVRGFLSIPRGKDERPAAPQLGVISRPSGDLGRALGSIA